MKPFPTHHTSPNPDQLEGDLCLGAVSPASKEFLLRAFYEAYPICPGLGLVSRVRILLHIFSGGR